MLVLYAEVVDLFLLCLIFFSLLPHTYVVEFTNGIWELENLFKDHYCHLVAHFRWPRDSVSVGAHIDTNVVIRSKAKHLNK